MTTSRRTDVLFGVVILVTAALFLPRAFIGDAAYYEHVMSYRSIVALGGLVKLFCLGLVAVVAGRIVVHFRPGNLARPGWRLMQVAFAVYFLAQLTLSSLNLLRAKAPFPSPADALYVAAMLLIIASLTMFVSAYVRETLAGPAKGIAALAGGVLLAVAVFDIWLMRPIVAAAVPPLETLLNVAYPALDSVVLVLAAVLLRITLQFRGGQVWKVWLMLLGGFLLLCGADITYAYSATMGIRPLEPVMDVMFMWSYVLLARATLLQHELLTAHQDTD